jgi:CRISPR-associated Csx10 family RAMP protein
VEFRLTVDVRTALAVGAGPQTRGGVTRAARDLDGYPMVPATTIKGALRSTLERLLAGADHPDRATVVAVLFGAAGQPGVLRFSDARLADESVRQHLNPARHGTLGTELRGGVALDRASRTPSDHLHAGRETTAPFMTGLKLAARVETIRALTDEELAFLKAAARGVTALGGERSRGAGQARLEISGPLERQAIAPRPGVRPPPRRDRPPAAPSAGTAAPMAPESATPPTESAPAVHVEASQTVEASPATPATAAPADLYRVLLNAREPFRAPTTAARTPSFSRSSDRVPGATLRGALASALLSSLSGGADHAVFRRAFVEGKLRVTDAIPAGRRVTPATLVTCDTHPGFHLRSGARVPSSLVSHGAWDTLLLEFLRARLGAGRAAPYLKTCQLNAESGSGTCNGAFTSLTAPYISTRIADEQTAPFAAVTSARAVDRASGRSSRTHLHGAEATLPGKGISRYEGELAGVDAELAAALNALSEIRVGGGVSTGRGLMQLHVEPGQPAGVRESLTSLEEAIVRLLETWPGGAITRSQVGLDRHRVAVLDLESDWIPTRWSASLAETVAHDLPKVSGLSVASARLTVSEAGGWNAAAGIAKPLRRALARGGVVLISYSLAHESEVIDRLEALAHRGIGHLTTEGYGQVRVSDPVHWERIPPLVEGR